MKKIEIIISEGGIRLNEPNDGFVVYGTITKADARSDLIGDAKTAQNMVDSGLEPRAYSVFEFLDALYLDPDVVYQWWLSNRKPGNRQDGFNPNQHYSRQKPNYNSIPGGLAPD